MDAVSDRRHLLVPKATAETFLATLRTGFAVMFVLIF